MLDGCTDCNALQAPITTIGFVAIAASIILAVWYLARCSRRFTAAMEPISFSVPCKIYFSTCQVQYTSLAWSHNVPKASDYACVLRRLRS